MGFISFSIGRLRAGASVSADGFTLWLENGQVQSSRAIPSEPDWQPEGQVPAEQGQPDEYAVPEGDEDWPMLVELCGKVYQAQGHAGRTVDRDATATLSVRDVARAGRAGRAGVDAGTGRLQRGVGMNMSCTQTISREEYRRLDNRVTCILQQRWPANEISQWVGMLKGKQQSVACAILRRRHPRPAQLALPAIATELPNPYQAKAHRPTVPVHSADGRPIGRRHIVDGLTPWPSTRAAPSVAPSPAAPSLSHRAAPSTAPTRAPPNSSTQHTSQLCTR